MEMYKKPVMEIVELEKVDVLTCSKDCTSLLTENKGKPCGHDYHKDCVVGECSNKVVG